MNWTPDQVREYTSRRLMQQPVEIPPTAKADVKRERELQIQIVSFLRIRGHTVIWSRLDRRLTATKGTPDILLAVRGRAVALEVKLPGGKLSEDQERMRDGLIADGWKYALVTSLEEARAVVDAVK